MPSPIPVDFSRVSGSGIPARLGKPPTRCNGRLTSHVGNDPITSAPTHHLADNDIPPETRTKLKPDDFSLHRCNLYSTRKKPSSFPTIFFEVGQFEQGGIGLVPTENVCTAKLTPYRIALDYFIRLHRSFQNIQCIEPRDHWGLSEGDESTKSWEWLETASTRINEVSLFWCQRRIFGSTWLCRFKPRHEEQSPPQIPPEITSYIINGDLTTRAMRSH